MNHRRLWTFPALALCAILVHLPAHANDWPQWRGPNRDGVVTGARLPQKWPEKLPSPKWAAVIGEGYSSPVIADGKVFIQSREKPGEESCLCFDAETGKPLWKVTNSNTFEAPDPRAGKGPNSTPTVDRDRVYMLGLGGMFHCIETKTGRVLWKHDLAKEYWGVEKDEAGSDKWFPVCGYSASALVDGDQVIVPVGGKKAGSFTAFNRDTGQIVWKTLEDRSSYASPLFAELPGGHQMVGFTGKRMVGLGMPSHEVLWEYPFTAMFEQTIISPVIWKDSVIISGEAKPTVCLQLSKQGDKVEQNVAWRNADLSPYMVTPVVIKDHLIGLDFRSRRITCVNLADGKTAWTSTQRLTDFASLVVAGERVLVLSNAGDLIVLEANPQAYTEVGRWKISEAGGTWSHPAVVGSKLYVKDKDRLLCFDLGTT